MPKSPKESPRPAELTAAEREWIRRQGLSARALEAEQRRLRERLVIDFADRLHDGEPRKRRRVSR